MSLKMGKVISLPTSMISSTIHQTAISHRYWVGSVRLHDEPLLPSLILQRRAPNGPISAVSWGWSRPLPACSCRDDKRYL